MTRLDRLDPHEPGPLTRLLLWLSRRKVAQISGREPDGIAFATGTGMGGATCPITAGSSNISQRDIIRFRRS